MNELLDPSGSVLWEDCINFNSPHILGITNGYLVTLLPSGGVFASKYPFLFGLACVCNLELLGSH